MAAVIHFALVALGVWTLVAIALAVLVGQLFRARALQPIPVRASRPSAVDLLDQRNHR